MFILTQTEVTNAMTTVYTILDYDYRHKNKGTGIVSGTPEMMHVELRAKNL